MHDTGVQGELTAHKQSINRETFLFAADFPDDGLTVDAVHLMSAPAFEADTDLMPQTLAHKLRITVYKHQLSLDLLLGDHPGTHS